MIDAMEPVHRHSPWHAVELGTVATLAGIPVVVVLAMFGWCLVKVSVEAACVAGRFTAFASVAVGAIAIGLDLKKAAPSSITPGKVGIG